MEDFGAFSDPRIWTKYQGTQRLQHEIGRASKKGILFFDYTELRRSPYAAGRSAARGVTSCLQAGLKCPVQGDALDVQSRQRYSTSLVAASRWHHVMVRIAFPSDATEEIPVERHGGNSRWLRCLERCSPPRSRYGRGSRRGRSHGRWRRRLALLQSGWRSLACLGSYLAIGATFVALSCAAA